MRTAIAAVLLLALPAAVAAAPSAKLEKEVRALLAEALRGKPSPKRVKALSEEHALADLAAAVRKGPALPAGHPKPRKVGGKKETLSTFGDVIVGYAFEHDKHVYRYAVDIPKGYDPRKPTGVLLDPGHGSGAKSDAKGKAGFLGMWRRFTKEAGLEDWLVVRTEIIEQLGPEGLYKPLPDDEITLVFDAFFRDLMSRFAVDPDRIWVTGLSQTGFWAWYLGSRRADRFAAIFPMSAVTWQVNRFAGNLMTVPAYVLHGDQDPTCPVAQARSTCAILQRMGAPVEYVEVGGGAHDYAVWRKLPEGLKKLAGEPRKRYPKRISKSVQTAGDRWCHWLRIDEIEREGDGKAGSSPTAGADAEIDGQTVHVRSRGVKKITLCFSSEMLDLAKPVVVIWNGKEAHAGEVVPSFATLLEIAAEKCDWTALYGATISLKR